MGDQDCPTPKKHPKHLCKLNKKGRKKEIAARSDAPQVRCDKCGLKANRAEDVCHPRTL